MPLSNETKALKAIVTVIQKQATGKLSFTYGEERSQLYFSKGQLVYAVEETHRVRRWKRAIQQHCKGFAIDTTNISQSQFWEYQLLIKGIQEGIINLSQAKGVVQSSATEVLFSVLSQTEVNCFWDADQTHLSIYSNWEITLSPLAMEQLLREVKQLQEQWQSLKLNGSCANQSPILKLTDNLQESAGSKSFANLADVLNGQYTFWDLSLKLGQSPTFVTRILSHFIHRGMIHFEPIPDLPGIIHQGNANGGKKALPHDGKNYLIMAIDDSLSVCQNMEKIVTEAGYRFIGVQDSVKAIPILIKNKPDMIFLDLIMPVASGYEICTQIRRISSFKDTPIAIITGNDGIIDRVRAKMSGSSDFLGKPISKEKILALVEKHLIKGVEPSSELN